MKKAEFPLGGSAFLSKFEKNLLNCYMLNYAY